MSKLAETAHWIFVALLLALFQIATPQNIEFNGTEIESEIFEYLGRCSNENGVIDSTNSLLPERGCFCDRGCARYGDCCFDSPFFDFNAQRQVHPKFSCPSLHLYQVKECPTGYENNGIRHKCEDEENEDSLSNLPVYCQDSHTVYSSLYCAFCNEEVRFSFINAEVKCSALKSYDLSSVFKGQVNFSISGEEIIDATIVEFLEVCPVVHVKPDFSSGLFRTCFRDSIGSCNGNWTNTQMREKCEAYTSIILTTSDPYVVFKNHFCAICNDVRFFRYMIPDIPDNWKYSEHLAPLDSADSNAGSGIASSNASYDTTFNATEAGKARPSNSSISDDSTTDEAPGSQTHLDTEQSSVQNKTDSADDYKSLNGSKFMFKCGAAGDVWRFTLLHENKVDNFEIYVGFVSYNGLTISITFLSLHLVAFAVDQRPKTLLDKNLASFVLTLLMFSSFFMIGQIVDGHACSIISLLTEYCFVGCFSWLLTMSFDVWSQTRLSREGSLVMNEDQQRRQFIVYSIWSWLIPSVVVLLLYFIENTAALESVIGNSRLEVGVSACWINQRKTLFLLPSIPVAVSMLLIIFFLCSIASMSPSTVSGSNFSALSYFHCCIWLTSILGCTWLIGLVASWMDDPILWLVLVAVISLQGVILFLRFTGKKDILRNKGTSALNSRSQ